MEERLKREKLNLEYENSDVKELEDHTLKALFYSVLGKKEERLIKEEREAEEAKHQYEGTLIELEQVNARIKRIELEQRELKRAERDYQNCVKDLSARIKEIEPLLSSADAVALETIQKELEEQKRKREYYTELIEESNKLIFYIQLVQDSLREMLDEDRMGTPFGEYAARKEAEERRGLVQMQAQRLKDFIGRGVTFVNDYTINIKSIDNMIAKVVIACNDCHDGPAVHDRLSEVPDLALNLRGMLNELQRKIERSNRFQSDLERRLSDLIQKY